MSMLIEKPFTLGDQSSFLTRYLDRQIGRVLHAWRKGRLSELDARVECADLILELAPEDDCLAWGDYVNALMHVFKQMNPRTRLRNDGNVESNFIEEAQ